MVNITIFGPWSGKKTATVEKAGIVHLGSGAGGLDSYDTEAHLLPLANESRWNRRGKFCCMAVLADICAFLALLLIIISTGFLLWKVWWVKAEVDRMQPAVMSLSASLTRLQVESDALQSENNALMSAYSSSQNGNLANFDDNSDDTPMEDTNSASLSELSDQDSNTDQLNGAEADMVGMAIYVAVGKADQKPNNLVDELKNMYDAQAAAAGNTAVGDDTDNEAAADDTDSILQALRKSAGEDQSDHNSIQLIPIPNDQNGLSSDGDDDDDEDTELPKTKAKDVEEDEDSDDDGDGETIKREKFSDDGLSDSD